MLYWSISVDCSSYKCNEVLMNKIETQVCTTIADYYLKILSSFLFFLLKSLIDITTNICIRGPAMKERKTKVYQITQPYHTRF